MNWKIKLLCNLFNCRVELFLVTLIFSEVTNKDIGNFVLVDTATVRPMHIEDSKSANQKDINGVEDVDDYDSEYPYEQLLELVKKTKRILSSTDATEEKRRLSLDPLNYEIYLRGNNSYGQLKSGISPTIDVTFSIYNRGKLPEATTSAIGTCGTVTESHKPKRLRSVDGNDQFILNVGDQFVQQWFTSKCVRPGKQCGHPSTWPENFEAVCEQNYDGTAKFFSVPVGKEINLSQQELRAFKIPNGCNCKLRPATSVK